MRRIDADALIGDLHNCTFLDGDDRSIVYNVIQKQPTVGNWVSVKDRLPEVGEKCLIRDKTDVTTARLTDKEHQIWQWEDSDFYGRGGITHWMPIPPGPEEDEKHGR